MNVGPCMRCDVCGRVEVNLAPVLDLVASPENRQAFYAGWSMKLTAGDIAREVVGIGRFRTRLVGAA